MGNNSSRIASSKMRTSSGKTYTTLETTSPKPSLSGFEGGKKFGRLLARKAPVFWKRSAPISAFTGTTNFSRNELALSNMELVTPQESADGAALQPSSHQFSVPNTELPSADISTYASTVFLYRSPPIETILGEVRRLAIVTAEVRSGLKLPSVPYPIELIDAVAGKYDPCQPTYRPSSMRDALVHIAELCSSLAMLEVDDVSSNLLQLACAELIEDVFRYLSPFYDEWPCKALTLRYLDRTVGWNARGLTGSHVWLMTPTCRSPDFADEAAYALSVALEFRLHEEESTNVWLVSIYDGHAVLVHATICRQLAKALESKGKKKSATVVLPQGGLTMHVGSEYNLLDSQGRSDFVKVLAGLVYLTEGLLENSPVVV